MLKKLFLVSPLERHFVWCGFKVDSAQTCTRTSLKIHTNTQKASKNADKHAQESDKRTYSNLTCTSRQKIQIGRFCILFDTMYSPASPPTQPTYTIHLHMSPEILLTQTHSSDTFCSFVCPLVCCKSFWCDELDTVKGIFFLSLKKNHCCG